MSETVDELGPLNLSIKLHKILIIMANGWVEREVGL